MARRPVFLNLFQIRLPVTGWVSILHRLSGVFLFLALPGLLWALSALPTPEGRATLVAAYRCVWVRLLLWAVVSAAMLHAWAGLRHLLMDLHWGKSLRAARVTAWAVILLTLINSAAVFWNLQGATCL